MGNGVFRTTCCARIGESFNFDRREKRILLRYVENKRKMELFQATVLVENYVSSWSCVLAYACVYTAEPTVVLFT